MTTTRTARFISHSARLAAGVVGGAMLVAIAGRATGVRADATDASPDILSVELRGVDGTIRYTDHVHNEANYTLSVWEADNRDDSPPAGQTFTYPASPGQGRTNVRTFTVPKANFRYCMQLHTASQAEDGISGAFGADFDSEIRCVDPVKNAAKPDLEVRRIGQERIYEANSKASALIDLHNDGADAVGNVEFTIMSSGAVTVTEMLVNANEWKCERISVPDHNAAFRCRGGTIRHGESAQPFFFFTTGGVNAQAILEARVTTTSGPEDRASSDNYLSKPVILGHN